MTEAPPERLPGAVVLMPAGAQFAEHELRGIEGSDVVAFWLSWLL